MEPSKLTDSVFVGAQISPEDVAALKAAGFTTIVCNRPDGEKPDQPSSDAVRAAAEAAGLEYHYNPMSPDNLTPDIVARQGSILKGADGKVFSHCATGRRSTVLWALCNPEGMDADERIDCAARCGHDISPLRPRL